ncbi:hypothetical protein [Pseudanabaena sp. 'Roaring Creek']|uniref:IS110 family transposase n=1 Tax=Pseudanabaena sp. 'Roaring Creek' TaxID=1681830 RepID=UPI0006D7C4AA|nr:hypothetical protein [Pseudanabaena sp. 'Roaring Creek']
MTTKKILGIDVSAHFVVCAIIENPIDDKLDYFRKNREEIFKISPNKAGIDKLLSLGVTHASLEPTGVHYSRIWAETLNANGIKLLWVGHCQLKAYRKSNRLPNKNDYADALALGCYGFEHCDKPEYFVKFDPFSISGNIRQLSLQLSHLKRVQSPIVNRVRQSLAFEFPEICEQNGKRSSDLPAPIWRYLAGKKISTQSRNKINKLLANSIGTGISDFTKQHAQRICDIQDQEVQIERQLTKAIGADMFAPYHKVFDKFGMGQRVRSYLLGTIFPLETYLDQNRKPIVELVRNKKGMGKSKRYRSLAAFKLALGHGLVEDSSGKSEKWIVGGSNLCRLALFQWEYTTIEPKRSRPNNDICKALGDFRDKLKANGVPIKLVRSRVITKAVEMLFRLLAKEI